MILKADQIEREIDQPENPDDPLIITPRLHKVVDGFSTNLGAASVDLRLGCWFLVCRHTHIGLFTYTINQQMLQMSPSSQNPIMCPLARNLFFILNHSYLG